MLLEELTQISKYYNFALEESWNKYEIRCVQTQKKPISNKPRTWLVDNTVATQSFSEWRIANNTCLKPKEKGDSRQEYI
jgi:hypothetical protein